DLALVPPGRGLPMARPHPAGRRPRGVRLGAREGDRLPPRLRAQVSTWALDACVPGPYPRPAEGGLRDHRGRDLAQHAAPHSARRLVSELKRLYHFHFQDERRERLFLASVAFLVTFAIVRGITHLIRACIGPFHNVTSGGLHIHHLVWGILLLLVVGYVWLLEVGVGSTWVASLTA